MTTSRQDTGAPSALRQVTSLCPVCLQTVRGILRQHDAGIVMERECPDHGAYRTVVERDLETYTRLLDTPRKITAPARRATSLNKGCPDDCGLCPSHDQHTCLAILEITSRCNLHCPICLADSGSRGSDLDHGKAEFALRRLIDAEGRPTPLQLSGGEPTLHPQLTTIVRRARSMGFRKIEVDTNGLTLAQDPHLAEELKDAGLSGVYLQMDGLTSEISRFIRGRDLVDAKLEAVENCRRAGLDIVFSVTVVPEINDAGIWDMIRLAARWRTTGINFQAVCLSGRFPGHLNRTSHPFTPGTFMHLVEKQSSGKLVASDFSPIPCPDPRCGLMSYALIRDDNILPLARFLKEEHLLDLLADLSDWDTVIAQISGAACCEACDPPAARLRNLLPGSDFFSIGYHGMMDRYTFDLERVRKCCIHELTPEGHLIPFCLFNVKYRSSHHPVPAGCRTL